MTHAEFQIGCEFTTFEGKHTWRCTDIGTRTIIAIRINTDGNMPIDPSWFHGPPYALAEMVFDEYSIEGCTSVTKLRTS
jgi:hypothetical protein